MAARPILFRFLSSCASHEGRLAPRTALGGATALSRLGRLGLAAEPRETGFGHAVSIAGAWGRPCRPDRDAARSAAALVVMVHPFKRGWAWSPY